MSDLPADSALTPPTPPPLAEGGPTGVIVHIPAVLDQATGDPIPLHVEANVVISGPAGVQLTFYRVSDDVLTSSVGYNLYIPLSDSGTVGSDAPSGATWSHLR